MCTWSTIKWIFGGWLWSWLTADPNSKPAKHDNAQQPDDGADKFDNVAGRFDDALSSLLLIVDAMHSATRSHIMQLNTLKTNCREASVDADGDIELSKSTLQNVELSLMQSKNVLVKVLQSIQHICPYFPINFEKQMTSTSEYLDEPRDDDDAVVTNLDAVLERSKTIKKFQERLDKLEEKQTGHPVTTQPQLQVQVCKHADSSVLTDATELLMEQLNSAMDVKAECTTLTNTESAQHNVPLLILCIQSSRLGTDALNAIKGVLNPHKTALVIVHYKEEHALTETPSKRILVGSEFDQIEGIFDIAYTKEKGVYSCKMNNRTQKEITTFINR